MRKFLLVLGIMALICSPAIAGKNAGGAMVVHTDDSITYTFFAPPDYCALFPYTGDDCRELNATSNFVDPNFLLGTLVYYVAAFPPGSAPGVTVVFFGHDHNIPLGFISGWSFCGPPNSLEVPDDGWPDDVNAGNSVGFGSAVAGDLVFPYYWLGVYGDAGNFIGPRANPTGGYAGYVSDDNPGVLDEIFKFGTMGWFGEGQNDCPDAPTPEACCFEDGSCMMLLAGDCLDQGGAPQGAGTVCEPNDCPQPPDPEACCFEDGSCMMLLATDCVDAGGTPQGEGTVCEPNDCPQPPDPEACCFEDGSCMMLLADDCTAEGGTPQGEGTVCEPNDCPQPPMGACCLTDGSCVQTTQADCNDLWIPDTPCEPENPCPPVATEDATWGQIKSSYK